MIWRKSLAVVRLFAPPFLLAIFGEKVGEKVGRQLGGIWEDDERGLRGRSEEFWCQL